jgi:hypothetical protein
MLTPLGLIFEFERAHKMKRYFSLLLLFFCPSIMLSACELPDLGDLQKQLKNIKDLRAIVVQQQNEIAELKKQVEQVTDVSVWQKNEIADLNFKSNMSETLMNFLRENAHPSYNYAEFDPSDTTYQRIESGLGAFAISIEEVKPHADGVRVRLRIGNLTSGTFNGGKINVEYGVRQNDESVAKNYYDWLKAQKKKEINFTEDLRPGFWNNVSINLPGIPPQKFGYMKLSFETSKMSLLMKKQGN